MSSLVDLKRVLDVAVGKVDARKLELLERKLEGALGRPLSSQVVEDPIVIRRLLVKYLRSEGVSQGVIHSFEQFFMGIVRRAAVEGLLPAPPEGPWTRLWQSVLDVAAEVQGARAPLRSLAGWATARDLEPTDLEPDQVKVWAKDLGIDKEALLIAEGILARWLPTSTRSALASDSFLSERLQKKALQGTVKSIKGSR